MVLNALSTARTTGLVRIISQAELGDQHVSALCLALTMATERVAVLGQSTTAKLSLSILDRWMEIKLDKYYYSGRPARGKPQSLS